MTSEAPLQLDLYDLMQMSRDELHQVLKNGHPLEPETLAGRQYLGVDLSLPGWARKLLWHTFRKTFVRDEHADAVRGWNVRMQQLGVDGPQLPMTDKAGAPITFGHYHVGSAEGQSFPDWQGRHLLNYGVAGNPAYDLAGLGFTPLVAVNAGSQDLLLGWEVFRVAGVKLPLPLYWALRYDGPLEHIVPPPNRS